MKNYLENYTSKKNTDYLVKNTNASNVFYTVLCIVIIYNIKTGSIYLWDYSFYYMLI